ncbi:MAG TPA: transglutaminase-like domain-containing protein [Verrucomicrobiae bacterium]|nr:transglutaminase-like domain-containing protein [Verrucomicrobiae bacterium]
MISVVTGTQAPDTLSESQKAALIRLLGDDDPAVYQVVKEKILTCGQATVEWLRPHTLSRDPMIRRHAQEIIRHLTRQTADDKFLAFCLTEGADLNLEQAAWMLARTRYPEINVEAYQALFDNFAGELLEHVDLRGDAGEILAAFNQYVFGVLRFRGNEENYYDPENSYLNRVVDRRTGNPINLCLVYLMLARRLRLPMAGIGLPGHFICRYQSSMEEFYVDVFNRGKLWTKANCIQYLVSRNYNVQDDHLAPVSSRRMLARICSNLHQVYHQQGQTAEATRLQRYLVALAK